MVETVASGAASAEKRVVVTRKGGWERLGMDSGKVRVSFAVRCVMERRGRV